jgi:hypothetical protein
MNWFEQVFGFREEGGFDKVKSRFEISHDADENILLSTAAPATKSKPKRTFHVGRFDTPKLEELRIRAKSSGGSHGTTNTRLTFQHIVANVEDLHREPKNNGKAVFQVASQFNCLEMVDPSVTREKGITGYAYDGTQGPACAMACPAGTLYRNYFAGNLDTLTDVGVTLKNHDPVTGESLYWKMSKGGYALAAKRGSIKALSQKLRNNETLTKDAMSKLRVGVHWNTQVDMGSHANKDKDNQHVAQVYCSALPISCDNTASDKDWEAFARFILEGAYEATLAVAAILADKRKERVTVYLTMLGGGAFGNLEDWIRDAIQRALLLYRTYPLDVCLVHFNEISPAYSSLSLDDHNAVQCRS